MSDQYDYLLAMQQPTRTVSMRKIVQLEMAMEMTLLPWSLPCDASRPKEFGIVFPPMLGKTSTTPERLLPLELLTIVSPGIKRLSWYHDKSPLTMSAFAIVVWALTLQDTCRGLRLDLQPPSIA